MDGRTDAAVFRSGRRATRCSRLLSYGMGDPGLHRQAAEELGVAATISAAPEVLQNANKMILPGVGAFDSRHAPDRRRLGSPTSSIARSTGSCPCSVSAWACSCMTRGSEEGGRGRARLDRRQCVPFVWRRGTAAEVPHMGWNTSERAAGSLLVDAARGEPRFYFVHIPITCAARPPKTAARATYGMRVHGGRPARQHLRRPVPSREEPHSSGWQLLAELRGPGLVC